MKYIRLFPEEKGFYKKKAGCNYVEDWWLQLENWWLYQEDWLIYLEEREVESICREI